MGSFGIQVWQLLCALIGIGFTAEVCFEPKDGSHRGCPFNSSSLEDSEHDHALDLLQLRADGFRVVSRDKRAKKYKLSYRIVQFVSRELFCGEPGEEEYTRIGKINDCSTGCLQKDTSEAQWVLKGEWCAESVEGEDPFMKVRAEMWEDDKGDRCTFQNGDDCPLMQSEEITAEEITELGVWITQNISGNGHDMTFEYMLEDLSSPQEDSAETTAEPSAETTAEPSAEATVEPSDAGTTAEPSDEATVEPSAAGTTAEPSAEATAEPSATATSAPETKTKKKNSGDEATTSAPETSTKKKKIYGSGDGTTTSAPETTANEKKKYGAGAPATKKQRKSKKKIAPKSKKYGSAPKSKKYGSGSPSTAPTAAPEPEGECSIYGDPHIVTFDSGHNMNFLSLPREDGHVFDYGDFWLIKSKDVHIQARYMSQFVQGKNGSVMTWIAVGGPFLQNHTLIVGPQFGEANWWTGSVKTHIPWSDWKASHGGTFEVDGLISARYSNETMDIEHPDRKTRGIQADLALGVRLTINRFPHLLAVKIVAPKLPGGQDGQCGNFNGIAEDDTAEFVEQRMGASLVSREELLFPYPLNDYEGQEPAVVTD